MPVRRRSLAIAIAVVAVTSSMRAPAAGDRVSSGCGGTALLLDDAGKVMLLDTCTGATRRAISATLPWTAAVAGRRVVLARAHDIVLLDAALRVTSRKPVRHVRGLAVLQDSVVATTPAAPHPLVLSTRTLRVLGRIPVTGQGALAAVRGRVVGALAPGAVWSSDGRNVERIRVPLDLVDAAALGDRTLLVGTSIAGSRRPRGHAVAFGLGTAGSKPFEIDLGAGNPVMLAVLARSAYVISGLCGAGYRVARISAQGELISTRRVDPVRTGAIVNGTIVLASQGCDGAPAVLESLDPETLDTRPLPAAHIDTPRLLRDATALR